MEQRVKVVLILIRTTKPGVVLGWFWRSLRRRVLPHLQMDASWCVARAPIGAEAKRAAPVVPPP